MLRAIERKDIMTLADIKSRQFDLLLNGNPLPLVYAMRQGKSCKLLPFCVSSLFNRPHPSSADAEVAIILIGAMSRKVNDVSDDELALMEPSTKATLYVRVPSIVLTTF